MIKSQSDLNPCNDGKRSSDVLLSAIDELEELRKENEAFERLATNLEKDCERLLKQLDIAVKALDSLQGVCFPQKAEQALREIKELEN